MSVFKLILLDFSLFKELNKVKKAALSLGFYELFDYLALALQREMANIKFESNPESMIQIQHSIECLKSLEYRDSRKEIQPFITNFAFNRK